ncbi:hypothetical protein [Bradyrhizobium sp. 157]|uniref:hypothetical protein n=1 Tax=Bradyrhizobium sp. 157 TaxID=2782631 RepID=UPI001FF7F26C|nr:hypothetical protein [Bradyrhizobium sp. 157]
MRLASFGLMLHEGKTRLIEFGRFAALSRQRRGQRRPEIFAFLGFTHYCGRTRDGRFIVKHKTEGKRLTRKLTALRQDAWRFMHESLATQHEWFASVLRGHYGYYGRPHNYPALNGFYREVRRTWMRYLKRSSQKSRRMGWSEFETLTSTLPSARSTNHSHLGTGADMTRVTLGKEPGAGKPPARICEGKAKWPSYSTTTVVPRSKMALWEFASLIPVRRLEGQAAQSVECAARAGYEPDRRCAIAFLAGSADDWACSPAATARHREQQLEFARSRRDIAQGATRAEGTVSSLKS